MSTTASIPLQVLLPELGESVTEGQIVGWRVSEGDVVEAGQALVDVTTDKVDVEVPAPRAGRVTRLLAAEGDTVAVGAPLAELGPVEGGDGALTADEPARPEGGRPGEEAAQAAAAERPDGRDGAPVTAPDATIQVVLPELGESVTEGQIIGWRVSEGDVVEAGQALVDVTTDKVDVEVPAPRAGRVTRLLAAEGDTVTVGAALAELAPVERGDGALPAEEPARPEGGRPVEEAVQEIPPRVAAPAAARATDAAASPLARRVAAEGGLDLAAVSGTGPGGIVRRRDVVAALERGPDGAAAAAPPAAPPDGEVERAVALRGPAAALAAYMDESLTVPTATSVRTVNVGVLDDRRRALNAALAAAGRTEKLSYTHLVAWAIVRAVQRWPVMGTGFRRTESGPERLDHSTVNLGLAVDVERKDGSRTLLVPVVRAAETLGFAGFLEAYADVVARARDGKLKPDELRGATVSLTNPGGLGTVASVPRLMAGQGTIVATGAIGYPAGFERTPAERLADLGVDKVMTMTSTYDHRVIQGAESGAFLRDIEGLLQGTDGFYEDVAASLGVALEPAPERPAEVPAPAARPAEAPDGELMAAVAAAMSLVKAYRTHGHLAARLDPLGSKPPGDPALDPATVHLTPELMARIPAELLRVYVPGETFADALPRLRETYCGTIAYEIEHISSHQQRVWLREQIESGESRAPLTPAERVWLLEQLVEVDVFERFLRRTYLGQKTFSVEGCDALIPMIQETVELCSTGGAAEIIIGMAHRGRLAVIAHVVGRPVESILAEFEGHLEFESRNEEYSESAGDVKYHLGAEGTYLTRSDRPVTIALAANPSHLEQVNAVAEGRTRARQTIRKGNVARVDHAVAVPVLVHGDAAFPGQGVNSETLNLQALDGYSTGGSIHIIANNQIGFTTDPPDSRSTRYASDLAKGFDLPIIHVNADDVEACMSGVRLAVAFRQKFERDVLIDLIGYRRLGHNELDEPAYTQPVMSRTIKEHPPASQLYAQRLIEEGLVDEAWAGEMAANQERRLRAAHDKATGHDERGSTAERGNGGTKAPAKPLRTAVPAERLISLNEQLISVPSSFKVHPKLAPQLERRRAALTEGEIVWAHAESLALASLLVDGVPVRLTGQDTVRGTFSQRHLELHDIGEDESYKPRPGLVHVPMAHLVRASATLELHNSPLSEAAAVGFEYGYSIQAPEALVVWEAQYGDFANGAQIMVDQFIVSGRAKWNQASRLSLLLPHGYEGNGPEHSSARIERYLQLAAEGNIRVTVPSTAAQYFHLLRRQALTDQHKPLIVFTPKSLLREPRAASRLEDLTQGRFEVVIDDPREGGRRESVRRLILCTGKVYYDLTHPRLGDPPDDLAIARIELLYPFPDETVQELFGTYPALAEVVWVQEEPRNMGAWEFASRRLETLLPEGAQLSYVGRSRRASPSEGYPQAHRVEQERLVAAALGRDSA